MRWTELAKLAVDPRADPARRRQAERQLCRILEGLTVGEQITLARRAAGTVVEALARSSEARILVAVIGNARLLEATAVEIARNPATPPAALSRLAADARWRGRRAILHAVVLNPAAPPQLALGLLRKLDPEDLRGLPEHPAAPRIVRVAARRMLQGPPRRSHDAEDLERDRP